jgi:hypothetical protein
MSGKDTSYTAAGFPDFTGKSSAIPIPAKSGWFTYHNEGGKSSVSLDIADGAARVVFSLDKGTYEYDPHIGVGFNASGRDLSRCEFGLGYAYRGSPHAMRFQQSDIKDHNYHGNAKPLEYAADWTTINIPWAYFLQGEWSAEVPRDPSKIVELTWHVETPGGSGTSGEFWIKDLRCLESGDVSVSPRRAAQPSRAASFLRVSGRTLHIRLPQSGKVDVFNLRGGKIRALKLTQGDHAINMNGLPRGIYIVKAESGAGSGASRNTSARIMIK